MTSKKGMTCKKGNVQGEDAEGMMKKHRALEDAVQEYCTWWGDATQGGKHGQDAHGTWKICGQDAHATWHNEGRHARGIL